MTIFVLFFNFYYHLLLAFPAKVVLPLADGQIYASGGFNIHRLNTVECYNPQTDMWLRVQHMNWGRSHHKMLALNGRLWAIGGECMLYFKKY